MRSVKTLFFKNNTLYILNQLLLPRKAQYVKCKSYKEVADAIKKMVIRGAPAIGVAAAFGVALAANEKRFSSPEKLKKYIQKAVKALSQTRPTAVNLFWSLQKMKNLLSQKAKTPDELAQRLKKEALKIYNEDISTNKLIGKLGSKLFKKKSVVITHCNAGALATAGYGTALGVIRSAYSKGKIKMVFVDETRPYLQGSRLTAWEMKQENIPYVLITDNMAGYFMKTAGISAVIVGADRIARNGDTANKIGTYSLSVLAKYHKIPFYVAAPISTIDLNTPSGDEIVIEERSSDEVLYIHGKSIAPIGARAYHPGFDVTPSENITAIITEKGVFKPKEIKNIHPAL
ncbi:MAG: S-methyl-5-thioribose-1-phosphate isomerase [Elusimicrobia bacterium]|nr:S-methyl-5-thioribose-1-phosphate isomerase [Elusimicrobiota bacterium]